MPKRPHVRVEQDHVVILLPITEDTGPPAASDSQVSPPAGDLSHSPDFASVRWHGQVFTFSRKQRLIVAALWRAWEQGHKWLSTETLMEAAESDGLRVRDLFRGHPAWGELIEPAVAESGSPGTYRLAI